MQINDKALLKSAKQRDPGALAQVYEQYSPGIFRYAYRLLGSRQSAEDCVSDTFMRFLAAIENQKGPDDYIQAYLYRSAHNWIVDHFRKHSQTEAEINEDYSDQKESIETETEKRIRIKNTLSALEHLTVTQKEIILFRYGEDLSIKEIAKIIWKSQGAVKALLHRAIDALQKELSNEK